MISRNKKIDAVCKQLNAYCQGNFSVRGKPSDKMDDIDAIVMGVNLLGDELNASVVSAAYFRNIFNAVHDLILVIDTNGHLVDANAQFKNYLATSWMDIEGLPLHRLLKMDSIKEPLKEFESTLKAKKSHQFLADISLHNERPFTTQVLCKCTKLSNPLNNFEGYLIVVEDIKHQTEKEKLVLQTILDTQEEVQKRIAKDLHDSLGQELAGVHLLLSSLKKVCTNDSKNLNRLNKGLSVLNQSIKHLQDLCFDLMPRTLEEEGLHAALEQLIQTLNLQNTIHFKLQLDADYTNIEKDLALNLYRIVQEFISNSIKHSGCSEVNLLFLKEKGRYKIELNDNGKGFNRSSILHSRGLNNIKSRCNAYDAALEIKSKLGHGVKLTIAFPKKQIKNGY